LGGDEGAAGGEGEPFVCVFRSYVTCENCNLLRLFII